MLHVRTMALVQTDSTATSVAVNQRTLVSTVKHVSHRFFHCQSIYDHVHTVLYIISIHANTNITVVIKVAGAAYVIYSTECSHVALTLYFANPSWKRTVLSEVFHAKL